MDRSSRNKQSSEPAARRLPTWPVVSTFIVVVIAFFASITVSQVSESRIHGMSVDIASNAAPSIQYLALSRTQLLDLKLRLQACLFALEHHLPAPIAESLQAEAQVDDSARTYLALPKFPGETKIWSNAARKTADVHHIFREGIQAVAAGDVATVRQIANSDLPAAVEKASLAIYRDILFNADQVQRIARKIEQLREFSMRLAYALGILAAVLTVWLGIMMSRALRRYADLQAEHSRVLEELAAELDLFAARVAHDIMNPLAAVGATFQLAPRLLDNPDKLSRALERGASSNRRAVQIVEGLYSFARAGARPQGNVSTDVGAVLCELVRDLSPGAEHANVDLVLEPFEPCAVTCSTGVLTSLAGNLIGNALKYAPSEGDQRGRVTVSVQPGPMVRIEVHDTGPGLPPGMEETVFEPYIRAKGLRQPGLGLGLATVKRLSEAHGGTCGVRSPPGEGATFWFEVPRAEGRPSDAYVAPHAPDHTQA